MVDPVVSITHHVGGALDALLLQEAAKYKLNFEICDDWTVDSFEPREEFSSVVAQELNNGGRTFLIRANHRHQGNTVYIKLYENYFRRLVNVTVLAADAESAMEVRARLRVVYPEVILDPEDNRISIAVWAYSNTGGIKYIRTVDAFGFDVVSENYTSRVRNELDRLRTWTPPTEANGKLILWHGSPGTGKTHAIRMLAKEWQSWAELHFISDPEQFFGGNPNYLFQVAMGHDDRPTIAFGVEEGTPEEKWRIIVLEDSGELLGKDAKLQMGQGLSRFLNLTDGLLGQGLRTLVLVTTNEEIGELHEAVRRPGRCLASVAFDPMSNQEADAWLKARGWDKEWVPTDTRLSNLYDLINNQQLVKEKDHQVIGFKK